MQRWTQIFKALANLNRLKIIKLLSHGPIQRTVGEIAREIHVTLKGTSKHLILLHNLGILGNVGRNGHVYYYLNRNLPNDLRKSVKLFI